VALRKSQRMKAGLRRFMLFGIAGTLGFVVDAGITLLLLRIVGMNYYVSRLVAFLCAVVTTYHFNRRYTFADQIDATQTGFRRRYLVAMVGGFALNYGTYAALGLRFPFFHEFPVVAILAGSFAGLLVNYLSSKYWVFRATPAVTKEPAASEAAQTIADRKTS